MKILLSGATGRVGLEIERLAAADPALTVAGRASRDTFFAPGVCGDVLVDFSRPELTIRSLELAMDQGLPIVIGTTGLPDDLQARIDQAAKRIALCQAANFSIGVQVLHDLVARAAASLPAGFDIEIAEIHHRWKVDAPSGTALALGQAAARGRATTEHTETIRGDGARRIGEIGYQVARGGDVIGEHSVQFLGDGERVELTHRATDRAIFARGALHAARWLLGRPPGHYSMIDVLGLAEENRPQDQRVR
ncbi:MAG: 4-hydroxy-tetrahydrodipicolinate reductase [Wenzhouxiangellaceae bacterium]|nr:4-hydroxy-tetrahydrodipicolinate reductase [Wenzhouxiangellaceae bacterium]